MSETIQGEYLGMGGMNTGDNKDDPSKAAAEPSSAAPERRIPLLNNSINSRDLFVETREITIMHGAEPYRLRLTAQNKLILTK
jgi:hemin uptake protein HemP